MYAIEPKKVSHEADKCKIEIIGINSSINVNTTSIIHDRLQTDQVAVVLQEGVVFEVNTQEEPL